MGQTLTHGVYLPNEGERNCYSGLASNWRLLDGAIGTVAAHTTAIAGKADISHSHGNISNDGKVGTAANKPLITGTGGAVQAGSFGNQANTFCEGNDSRLSDARTPVAHTHTKSDVTDLLNSDFIPSANNSYDLGSSSYQWNNLYAKGYYYNSVAWGLDKENTWSNINSYQREIRLNGDRDAYIAPMWEGAGSGIAFLNSDATKTFVFGQHTTDANNKKVIDGTKGRLLIRTGERNGETVVDFEPRATNAILGTSTNKWKTLNGINPGALSLPDFSAEFDVSGQIVPPAGENQISINWGKNTFTPSVNGWLSVRIHKATVIKIYRESRASYCFNSRIDSADDICVCSPVVAGVEYTIKIQATQFSSGFDHFRLSPCQGNV